MDTLGEDTWDVVIVGTSLPQSLLALSLSRSGLKILHIDGNEYYGGADAGLSLDQVEAWAQAHQTADGEFEAAAVTRHGGSSTSLRSSRSYTLNLLPQIIYARSRILSALVSSRINTQLEFKAVGSSWVLRDNNLTRIPSSREDIVADTRLSVRDKRMLMKFLRFAVLENEGQEGAALEADRNSSFEAVCNDKFPIPRSLQSALLALALSPDTPAGTDFDLATVRIRRHMGSMGHFGPGFGAVVTTYGGNAEITQVACRAGAVGGAVYLLGYGLRTVSRSANDAGLLDVELSDGTRVRSRHVVGTRSVLPTEVCTGLRHERRTEATVKMARSVSIISNPLGHLFPQTSEDGHTSAVTVVMVDNGRTEDPPVYLQINSPDTGVCPVGQCIIHGSTLYVDNDQSASASPTPWQDRITEAIQSLLQNSTDQSSAETLASTHNPRPEVLWSMSYTSRGRSVGRPDADAPNISSDESGCIISFPAPSQDMAFDDSVLDDVKAVWRKMVSSHDGSEVEDGDFLRFEDRQQNGVRDGDENASESDGT